MVIKKISNSLTGYSVYCTSSHEPGAIASFLYRHQDRRFAMGSPAPFPRLFTAYKSIVQFHHIAETINAVPMFHNRTYLPEHTLGGYPGYIDLLAETKCGDASFIRSHQINRPEPFNQRQIGRMKDRSRSYTRLMVAFGAFIDTPGAYIAVVSGAAYRAYKSMRPPDFAKFLNTIFFCPKASLPFNKRYLGHFHNKTSCLA
jgi:hypothetical protein